ncbi:unnamed protein product, partial [Rotaria sp. Silwood2]
DSNVSNLLCPYQHLFRKDVKSFLYYSSITAQCKTVCPDEGSSTLTFAPNSNKTSVSYMLRL